MAFNRGILVVGSKEKLLHYTEKFTKTAAWHTLGYV
jgi:hypothetical protein